MRTLLRAGWFVPVLFGAAVLQADDLKSGLQIGEYIGAFTVEKCAGNPNDGVGVGQQLCYRCMLGNRPVVAVFARQVNNELATLVEQLDQLVIKHEDQKLATFVNLIGDEPDQLKSAAKKLVEKSKAKNVAVVVPKDYENGPKNLKLNPDAGVTVMLYREGTIEATHAVPTGKLDKKTIAAIVADSSKILN